MTDKYLINFWKGKVPLWKSYWLVGELLNALFILFLLNIEIFLLNKNHITTNLLFLDFTSFSFLTKIILISWTFFLTVSIWRSAENYRGSIIWILLTFLFLSYRIFSLRLIIFG